MSFWDGMKLWEKMLFVLGCAIICTLAFAVSKLMYNNRRVKNATKLAEARKAHLENVRSSRHVIELRGDDVPFGVKALEKGIEVEGIVISRPATPTSNRSQQTLVGSDSDGSRLSLAHGQQQMRQTTRPLLYQPSPYISIPGPLYHGIASPSSVVSTSGASAPNGFESQEVSPDLPSGSSTPKSVPDPGSPAAFEGRFSSQNSYRRTMSPPPTNNPATRSSRAQSGLPTLPDGVKASTLLVISGDSTTKASRSNSSDDISEIPSRPRLVTAHSTPAISSAAMGGERSTETIYGDLALLHTHRLSHAAEVGQLLPRANRTSRILPGGNFSSHSPFVSPTTTDPVYDLDVVLPPTIPSPALKRHSLVSSGEQCKTFSGATGEASRFSEQFWGDSNEQKTKMQDENSSLEGASVGLQPELKRKEYNKLRKKRANLERSSIDVDLEAQQ
ncbi:hypothetical protein FN846DRAFT_445440 [Sphaerosporella brunnea]|uniref:Uncharacterized protein n=1 Tax=Sphaerosporella brunnea TaxID=1250544 RepID=A0A5J5EFR0_9PEZI|nr:hypothetical protein FN846DRAFT_445440 [Sphaerosporella brunnea]